MPAAELENGKQFPGHNIHTNSAGDGGYNLHSLISHLGIADSVLFIDPYLRLLGLTDDFMVNLFNSFDVLLSPSMGEGFGVPILEAQSCGTPVIVGDWTSMSELCFAGWTIPQSEAERTWMPLGHWQYAPHTAAIAERIEAAYLSQSKRDELALAARAGSLPFDADVVTNHYWAPLLLQMEQRIPRTPPAATATGAPQHTKAALLLSLIQELHLTTPCVVEIGSVRSAEEQLSDGWSTVHISQALTSIPGATLYSVDINPASITIAAKVLAERALGLCARLVVADGTSFLRAFDHRIDLLYLDGSDDPDATLQQFMAASDKLGANAIVAIDDCHSQGVSVPHGKGTTVIPYAVAMGWHVDIVPTIGPYRTAVLRRTHSTGDAAVSIATTSPEQLAHPPQSA